MELNAECKNSLLVSFILFLSVLYFDFVKHAVFVLLQCLLGYLM